MLSYQAQRPPACPTEFQPLVQQLLQDLPSYANRANVLAGTPQRYLILASGADFTPLPLTASPDALEVGAAARSSAEPQQVFFTTLARRYQNTQVTDIQEYHWLFLTQNSKGWWFAMMQSVRGTYPQLGPPSPPRDSSEGKLAQAIRLWLRDCRAQQGMKDGSLQ